MGVYTPIIPRQCESGSYQESDVPYKTHKITLDPTFRQRRWFSAQCGYARFAYNKALENFKAGLAQGNSQSWMTLNTNFNQRKKGYDWTLTQDQRAALYAIMNLGQAITNWDDGRAKFPKFKGRGHRQSWTTDEQSVRVEGKRVKLPKIGWVKMRQALRFVGEIIRVTISRTAHRWFVSITVETEGTEVVDNSTHPVIGIDVGINTLATLSDGTKYDNPRPLRRYEKKLRRAQRKLSRKVFRSKNWYKQKAKVMRLHYRIACIRNDAHHKATTDIVNRVSAIGIETLKVTNMLKNKKLAKSLSDSALGGFLSMLKSKAEARGIKPKEADQFFASSKTCSGCGQKKKDLDLSERTYHCSECGISIDRDVNAAINLRPITVG